MTFSKFWAKLCEKTPELKEPENMMRISVESLQKQLRKAFKAGAADQRDTEKLAEKLANVGKPADPWADIFGI